MGGRVCKNFFRRQKMDVQPVDSLEGVQEVLLEVVHALGALDVPLDSEDHEDLAVLKSILRNYFGHT
jgi:hypothetical protein